jgi:hypothetical protein
MLHCSRRFLTSTVRGSEKHISHICIVTPLLALRPRAKRPCSLTHRVFALDRLFAEFSKLDTDKTGGYGPANTEPDPPPPLAPAT